MAPFDQAEHADVWNEQGLYTEKHSLWHAVAYKPPARKKKV